MSRQLLLISTSTVHGSSYLEYCAADIRAFLDGEGPVLFVPYARPGGLSHDVYTTNARESFEAIDTTRRGRVLTLSMNNGRWLNAVDDTLHQELPRAELDSAVDEYADRLAAGATHAIRWTKTAVNIGLR